MTLSAALFKRLYQTIEEGRKSDAVLLLTQVFDHQNATEDERQRAFLRGLRMLADEYQADGNQEEAERHLLLAVDLFNKFFDSDLREGLALNRRLCEFYERTGAEEKLKEQLDAAYVLVRRMLADVSAVALTGDMQRTGTSNIADSSIEFVAEDKSSKALKVLLIEDNPDDALVVRDSVEDASVPLSLDWAETLKDGLERLHEHPVDVVLLDLSLPDSQNSATIRAIRNGAPRVPIVVLTGNDDREMILEALRTGARDYLIKGKLDPQQLVGSIGTAVQSRVTQQASDWENKLRLDTMRQVLRFTDQPAVVLDTKYGIVEANKKFCEVILSTEEHIRGASFIEICPHFPRTEFDDMVIAGGRRRFPQFLLQSRKDTQSYAADVGAVVDSFHNVRWLMIQFTPLKP
jgi:CheY-like chemotaxis protein